MSSFGLSKRADSVTACLFCRSTYLPRSLQLLRAPRKPNIETALHPASTPFRIPTRRPLLDLSGAGSSSLLDGVSAMTSPASSTNAGKMAPSTLDLFILTFNCAKELINPSVFGAHLSGALSQNATGLPDLVVL
jgi:hypothetical protein